MGGAVGQNGLGFTQAMDEWPSPFFCRWDREVGESADAGQRQVPGCVHGLPAALGLQRPRKQGELAFLYLRSRGLLCVRTGLALCVSMQ